METPDMRRGRPDRRKWVAGVRLTEERTLYGLVIREQGELIEFVSFVEAQRRQRQTRVRKQQT